MQNPYRKAQCFALSFFPVQFSCSKCDGEVPNSALRFAQSRFHLASQTTPSVLHVPAFAGLGLMESPPGSDLTPSHSSKSLGINRSKRAIPQHAGWGEAEPPLQLTEAENGQFRPLLPCPQPCMPWFFTKRARQLIASSLRCQFSSTELDRVHF